MTASRSANKGAGDFQLMKKMRRQEGLIPFAIPDSPLQEIDIAEEHLVVFGKVTRPAPHDSDVFYACHRCYTASKQLGKSIGSPEVSHACEYKIDRSYLDPFP